jgi:hypothetical protein
MAEETPESTTPQTTRTPRSTPPATPTPTPPDPTPPQRPIARGECEVGKGCDRPVAYKATCDDLVINVCEVHKNDVNDTFPGMTFVIEAV